MSNTPKRKRYDADFKRQVALEALRGEATIHEIAARFNIHPNQVSEWKKQALDHLGNAFGSKAANKEEKRLNRENSILKEIVAQRSIEVEWLSKKCKELGL